MLLLDNRQLLKKSRRNASGMYNDTIYCMCNVLHKNEKDFFPLTSISDAAIIFPCLSESPTLVVFKIVHT